MSSFACRKAAATASFVALSSRTHYRFINKSKSEIDYGASRPVLACFDDVRTRTAIHRAHVVYAALYTYDRLYTEQFCSKF